MFFTDYFLAFLATFYHRMLPIIVVACDFALMAAVQSDITWLSATAFGTSQEVFRFPDVDSVLFMVSAVEL